MISREELYRKSGIQIMNFNSIFQLFRARSEHFAPLLCAEKILFMPDLLSYMLTGKQVCEQTIASTSQLINPTTRQWDPELLRAAGIPSTLLPPLVAPGTFIGELCDSLATETGLGKVPVVAVAGHDTAAAVAAVPATDRHFAYLSSGTWSLMGIETEQPIINDASYNYNFTNEGGIEGSVRFLKNITGMWLLERCRADWEKEGRQYNYPEIVRMAEEAASFTTIIPPDDPAFANPRSMTEAIIDKCKEQGDAAPESDAEFVRCIFNSLAARYKEVLELLREMAPFPIEKLHVIGGGSQNALLNQYTADACGIPVVAGPAEATAIGNCLIQAMAQGAVADRWAMRQLIADSFPTETFYPRHTN
ncbi:rhamnulokinase [Parabacteroides sp. OttesenSCG-928-N08]|nr:rhamnulokinase [Parabacteroides sp. OttesenSCG-928-N08]